jgi:hypothetical protein
LVKRNTVSGGGLLRISFITVSIDSKNTIGNTGPNISFVRYGLEQPSDISTTVGAI